MSSSRAENQQMASIHVQLHLLVGLYEAASNALMTSSVKWGNQQHLQHRAGERISKNWDGDPGRPTPALHRNVQQRVSHQISQSSSNHAVTGQVGEAARLPLHVMHSLSLGPPSWCVRSTEECCSPEENQVRGRETSKR